MTKIADAINSVAFWLQKFNRPVELLQPGLSEDTIRHQWEQIGLYLPDELLHWYAWQNGVGQAASEFEGSADLFPWGYAFPLESAIKDYFFFNSLIEDYAPRYLSTWFPIFTIGGSDFYFIECDKSKETASIIFFTSDPDELDEMSPIVYNSLTAMLHTMVACFEEGAYSFSDTGSLEIDALKEALISERENPGVAYWSLWIEHYRKYHQDTTHN